MSFDLKVNGKTYQIEGDPETPLLYILRNDLGFKGVKYACGLEHCGACHVLIDGADVPSCQLHVGAVKGAEIITIEGLGTPENLHPLQEAFIEEQATQCGYCTPGLVIAAQGLLKKHRYPTQDQLNEALDSHLCRCGVHERVRRAIKLRIARPEPRELVDVRDLAQLSREDFPLANILLENPELDAWIRINAEETITVFSGKVEYGQGIKTALAQIAADELDVALERIEMVMGDTHQTPDEGLTSGSFSLETSGNAIRQAAAEARHVMLSLALEELEALLENISIDDGQIVDKASGKSTSYWEIHGGKPFNFQITGSVQPKPSNTYKLVGTAQKRVDLLSKTTGTHTYVQDLDLENMVHGRIVRPPTYFARLVMVDQSEIEKMPGVLKVVQDGSFLGVIANQEDQAVNAMDKLAEIAKWEYKQPLPEQEKLYEDLYSQINESYLIADGGDISEDPIPPLNNPSNASQTISATYTKPYHMHATIGPSSALGYMKDNKLTVWTHTQGVFPLRERISHVLKMKPGNIHLIHTEGSGTYGHNGADDASLDAAILAYAFSGRPVLLKWTRSNENLWEPYSPAARMKMQASLNENGQVIDWNHEVYSPPHLGQGAPDKKKSGLIAAWHLENPLPKPAYSAGLWNHGGSHGNQDPLYTFSPKRIVKHVQLEPALRVSHFRGLGSYANVFALESFVDEVAHAVNMDPIEFRIQNLEDQRAIDLIIALADKSNWGTPTNEDQGRGFAFVRYRNRATYCAVVVELNVDRTSGKIQLERAFIAGESGQVINPNGLSNQLEGGFIQSASMTLKEQVNYSSDEITSVDWESYPILTFSEIPKIETLILNRPGAPFMGAGEAGLGPAPAAIANAVYDAVGIRLRDIPFLPGRVKGILETN